MDKMHAHTHLESAHNTLKYLGLIAWDFYPDPKIALGVDEAVFKSLYPQVFCGRAKNNCPLFIMKPGAVDINALECVTTIDSMIKYQFHCMVHGDGDEYREAQKIDPNFNRYVTY